MFDGVRFLDLVILLALLTACVGGYRLGFVARAASWVGLAIGTVGAVLILPAILRRAGTTAPSSRLTVVILFILLFALLGQMAGLFFGSRLASAVPPGLLRTSDKVAGSVAGILGVGITLWLLLPAAANIPGWPAQQVRGSKVAQAFYKQMPGPPNALDTLRKLVGSSSFPSVFEGIAPAPDAGPAPESVALPVDVQARVKNSTVKVEGTACHRTQDGSGFAVDSNLIVTNAHVVAGEPKTVVMTPDGTEMSATVVYFDAARDLALLRVPRYNEPALPVSNAVIGETGAVFGHPGGQDKVAILPAAVRREIIAVGRDLYDSQKTERHVLLLSSAVRPGDSGGALVNTKGDVIGVIFALAPDKADTAYALSTSELRAVLALPHTNAVGTGPCLSE